MFPNFFERATEMRRLFDAHFDDPYEQNEVSHGIWNYWFVPEMYTFLRAAPERIFGAVQTEFMRALKRWSIETLGLSGVTTPSLNVYIDGCSQGLHSDFHNGVWGYVFSLTRWQGRSFGGGETLLFKDGVPNYKRHHTSGDLLYDLIPQEFNQLLVFDDRIVHAVRPVQGPMNPTEGRVVLVGHIYGGVPVIDGPLPRDGALEVLRRAQDEILDETSAATDAYGMISVRLLVEPNGAVRSHEILFNNIVSKEPDGGSASYVRDLVIRIMSSLRFAASPAPARVTVPVLIPVVPLDPIRFDRSHALSVGEARQRVMDSIGRLQARAVIQGEWKSQTRFEVTGPGVGFIEVDDARIRVAVDPAIMNPSQWAYFEELVAQELNAQNSSAVPR